MFRLFVLILSWLCVALSASANPLPVWFSSDTNLCRVDGDSNVIAQTLALRGIGQLAGDGQGAVWVATHEQLLKLGADGAILIGSEFKALGLKRDPAIATDPYDDSLWVADNETVFLLNATGQPLGSFPAPFPNIRQIMVGLDQSVWLLGNKQLARHSATGTLLAAVDLHPVTTAEPKAFLVDDLRGAIWLAGEQSLTQVDLATAQHVVRSIALPLTVQGIVLQPKTGALWVLTEKNLATYDIAGALVRNIDLLSMNITGSNTLVFDPIGNSIWVTHQTGVARFSTAGQLLAVIASPDRAKEITVQSFALLPSITLLQPRDGLYTNNPTPGFVLQYDASCNAQPCQMPSADLPSYALTAQLSGWPVDNLFALDRAAGRATYTPASRLPEGLNTFSAQARDSLGHLSNTLSSAITIDTIPPRITVISPASGILTNQPVQPIRGTLSEPGNLTVNGQFVSVAFDNSFSTSVTLQQGPNTISLAASDLAGNTASSSISVTLDSTPPAAVVTSLVSVGLPIASEVTITGAAASVEAGARVRITNLRTGVTVEVSANSTGGFSAQIAAAPGDQIQVVVVDAAENVSAPVSLTVTGGSPIPPDPATVATPIDPTVPTRIASSTAFLYSGPNPIQTGVAPGTIEARRAAVLRGKVLTRDNQPLPGVTITVLGHPEFGQTVSRTDGMFDMAANGGGYLTVNYSKSGYLPVQRTVNTPWQDYVTAPDVVMIGLDAQVTAIDLTAATPMQVARGSVVTDQDGVRQATLLFPQGTTATMLLPNGTTQALTTITVRATEYTVGANGPQAMPGPLPATSGYTYAVENSIDEAMVAGATSVQFNQPVYQYVDNFLHFPVGGIVPVGYYDRQKAAWIPSDNGVIVKILSVTGGIATLDTTGGGTADSAARLAALNITDNERIQLATLFAAGTSLWRVPITHFSPWDCNWPYGPPDSAKPPKLPIPKIPTIDKPDCQASSIIECQNRSLGESVPVTGTPYSLNYRSSRMPGYDANSVSIPLSGASLPPNVKRIDLVVGVAGRQFTQSFPGSPNQSYTLVWDGMDAYGRPVQGMQPASIRVGYVYAAVYRTPADFQRSFDRFGSGVLSGDIGRGEVTLWQDAQVTLGTWQAPSAGLGGWTLNVQHAYDPNGRVLYFGDGRTRSAGDLNNIISTVAGKGIGGSTGDGAPATAATFALPYGVTVDAQGNLYIAAYGNSRIRKVTPDGIISTVAGNGSAGFSGDGSLATAAAIGYPFGVAVDAQGNLYIADSYRNRIRKVTPDGIISTVAGNGSAGFSGDGGPATAAGIASPYGVTVDAQGNLYIADSSSYRIRKVTPDGIISTVAGNGSYGFSGDGGPATTAAIGEPYGVTIDAQGNLYISDSTSRIRKVTPDGIISTVAGNGSYGFSGDGGPAAAAALYLSFGVAADAQGNLYIADYYNNRVRKVSSYFPAAGANGAIIASEDGIQLYQFNSASRHLRTLSAATGAEQYRFAYDSNGFLIQIIDGDGNVTGVERGASGRPTAIVSSDGQRTALTIDANGYLASIANPAGESTRMTYETGGLLTAFTNPRNQSSAITYDARGRLIRDQNAAGGFWNLVRTDFSATSYLVGMTTALGRVNQYQVDNLPTGDTLQTNTQSDGSVSLLLKKTDGTTQTTAADGTLTTSVDGPDPRYGMQAPFTKSATIKTPSGLTSSITATRQAALSNPSDLLSLVTQTDTATVNGKVFKTVYNAAQHQFATTTPLNRSTVVNTDTQSRPLTVQLAGILPINYAYDTRGRLSSISQGGGAAIHSLTYAYNPQGYVDSVTDALNRATRYSYDAAGRVRIITLPDTRVIGITYDPNGNVTSVTPPGRPAHGFGYNAVDQATAYTPPALGIQPVATHYDYNLDKQPLKVTRPDGQTIDYGYDFGGRLASLTMPSGVIGYGYKAGSGQLASIIAPGGIGLAYSYDGALLKGISFTGPVAGSVSATYDNFFRVSSVGVNGSNIAFAYDADGLLTGAGSMTLARDSGNGFVTGTTLGQIVTSQSYDGFGQAADFTAKQGFNVLYDEHYVRDNAGRVTQKTVTLGGQTNIYGYLYDPAGRLTDVTKDGAAAGHFEYDANGNRTLADGMVASYDEQDRLTSFGDAQYTYTANGELQQIVTGATTTAYVYDVFGNLKHVDLPGGNMLDYLVDGRNRRIGKKINGTLTQGFLYQDQLKPAAELDAAGNVVSRFVYTGDTNVPKYMVKGGVTYRIIVDPVGSVRLVIDSGTSQVAQRIDYDDWGNVQSDSNPGFQPFGFAGGLYDRDTGLVRFGARDYDPRIGRWTAKDPIGFAGGDASLYGYVNNNPILWGDPEGLHATICLYSGAGPYGHVGIGINGGSTVGFYPADGDGNGGNPVTGTPGVVKPDTKDPQSCKTIATTPAQDTRMSDFIKGARTPPYPNYTLGSNNCVNFVRQVLDQAGIQTPDSIKPKPFFRGLPGTLAGPR